MPPEVVAKLRLKLDVTNKGTSTRSVYAGDLEVDTENGTILSEPIFNPTFKIAFLQPGKRLVITGIHIATGYGRDNGAFLVARRAAYRHLDIPQYTTAETHDAGGVAVDWSGYKTSCLVANPRHHVLTASLAATTANTAEVRSVFVDACASIKERLRLIATTIDRRGVMKGAHSMGTDSTDRPSSGVQFTVVGLEAGLTMGTLQVPGETHTIGELLRRSVYETVPDISYAAYSIVAHENQMTFQIRHTEDVTRILTAAVQHAIQIYDAIQRGISNAR